MTNDPDVLGSYWTLAGDVDPAGDQGWSPWDFERRVETAAEVGFTGIGLWHDDLRKILEERTLDEMRGILDEHGIEHVELEFVDDWFLPPDDDRRAAADRRRDELFAAADALDARHVKVGNLPRRECPRPRLEDAFVDLCAEARRYDATLAYEFIPSDPNVESLDAALSLVEGPPNGGVLLDSWHMSWMGVPHEAISRVPADQLVGVELNDGFAAFDGDFSTETGQRRQLPGEGEFDVRGFVDAVRSTGYDGPWGVEVLNAELRTLPMEELYRRAYDSTISILA